jgi:hypothetical protein
MLTARRCATVAKLRGAIGPTLLVTGVVLLVVAGLWRPLAVPWLARFPVDLDQTTRYEGTFTVHVDPSTQVPLGSPVELPLELERHIHTRPDESGADTVVVREDVTYRLGGTEQQEVHQYVMDRRSMENRDDPRSYAFDPANVVDRAGTYRVNLPLGVEDDGRYRIWENEPGQAFPMEGLARGARRQGLSLVEMEEVFEAPVADHYRDELRKQGFAIEIGFDVLAQRLAARGTDVDGALAALPASEGAVVAEARTATLPLRFSRTNDGHALVEPRTGSIVELLVSDEGIDAAVDLAPLAPLRDALARNAGEPTVAALADSLEELASAPPAAVYDLHYRQTTESVSEVAALTRDQVHQLDWLERWIPMIVAGVGLVLVAVGAVVLGRPRAAAGAPGA